MLKLETELARTKTVWLEVEKKLANPTSDGVLHVTFLRLQEFRFILSPAFGLSALLIYTVGWL